MSVIITEFGLNNSLMLIILMIHLFILFSINLMLFLISAILSLILDYKFSFSYQNLLKKTHGINANFMANVLRIKNINPNFKPNYINQI